MGELHGVVTEIGQDLAQSQRVAHQRGGHVGRNAEEEFQAFVLGFEAKQIGQIVHQVIKMEIDRLQRHLACFDFREIENVVDYPEQILAGTVHF